MKKIIFLFAALFSFPLNYLNAQNEDPKVGIYADGIKVNELNCYTFGTLSIVFPYNEAYAAYDKIAFNFYDGQDPLKGLSSHHSERLIPPASFFKYVKGNYFVYEIFSKGVQQINCDNPNDAYDHSMVTRGSMKYYTTGILAEGTVEEVLYVGVTGLKFNGEYKEGYNPDGSYYKYPTYDIENLFSMQIPLLNREKLKVGLLSVDTPNNKALDLSVSCTYSGTKLDFNSLVTSGTTTTTKPAATTPTTTAGPYSEKYESGKIKVQGQKNKEGEQEGTWKYFDENGKLERIENYKKGIAEGEWKYFEDGKLSKTEVYKDGEMISTTEQD